MKIGTEIPITMIENKITFGENHSKEFNLEILSIDPMYMDNSNTFNLNLVTSKTIFPD